MLGAASCVRRVAVVLLVVGVTSLVRAQRGVQPGPVRLPSSDAFRAQILGVRRIQFTRRPLPSTTNPTASSRKSFLHVGMTDDDGVSMVDQANTGYGEADAGGDVHDDAGSVHAPTQEQLQRHWNYRRMLLERERERMLHRIPTVIEGLPAGGGNTHRNNTTAHNRTGGGTPRNTRNCTEYSVKEGTTTVRLCDEVHLLNYTEDVDRAPLTTAMPAGSSTLTEAELEARRASLSGGGQMSGRDWVGRERYKQARLFMIQSMILQKLGIQHQPHVSDMDLSDVDRSRIMIAFHIYESELGTDQLEEGAGYIKTLGLLTPSCNLPRNTNRAWWNGERFRLYFKTQSPVWRNTKIFSATLHVYKRAIENCDTCYLRPSDVADHQMERAGRRRRLRRTQERGNQDNRHHAEEPETTEATPEENKEEMTEDSIKITVYYYIKSVKARRKEKVHELDSVIVPRSEEGWIKLNIKNAIAHWYDGTQHNFGLQVRITDHKQRELDPFAMLTPTNCSTNNNFSLPYPLLQTTDLGDGFNGTDADGNQTMPFLDLVMIGMPRIQRIQPQRYTALSRHKREAALRMGTNVRQKPVALKPEVEKLRPQSLSSVLQGLGKKIVKSKTHVTLQSKKAQHL